MSASPTGELFIGRSRVSTGSRFAAINPATSERLAPEFSSAGLEEVEKACALAAAAFRPFEEAGTEKRAALLERIAGNIEDLGAALIERAQLETGLPEARLAGERARTAGQLRLFAAEVRDGAWRGVRIDTALPERKPLPRPDLRLRKRALGPVVVFGASNFPLAFSVAGGDTASALAAGCPVIAKGHSAHPGTAELVASAIAAAVADLDLPEGVFSLLNTNSREVGGALVADPRVKAVGFTGSRGGGEALMKIAASRPEPIPVYAEMSAVNPVILLPGALEERAEALGEAFIGSMTLGAGQFCTSPGLVLALECDALDRFVESASKATRAAAPAVMLTPGIYGSFSEGVDRLVSNPKVATLARGPEGDGCNLCQAALFSISADDLMDNHDVAQEVFGASSVIVRCRDIDALERVIAALEGQLTVSLHMNEADARDIRPLLPLLEDKAGRLIANSWPTGVEVAHAMVHGGPYPATSDARTTSVGTLAIERFLRPICYQGFPQALLPPELRDEGPEGALRRIDGAWRL